MKIKPPFKMRDVQAADPLDKWRLTPAQVAAIQKAKKAKAKRKPKAKAK